MGVLELCCWVETTNRFKKMFRRVVGPEELLQQAAKRLGRHWFHGKGVAKRIFREQGSPVRLVKA